MIPFLPAKRLLGITVDFAVVKIKVYHFATGNNFKISATNKKV
jgi:hypothetical protein